MTRKRILNLLLCAALILTACGAETSERQAGVGNADTDNGSSSGKTLTVDSHDTANPNVDGTGATIEIRYNENYYPFPGGYTVCDVPRNEIRRCRI